MHLYIYWRVEKRCSDNPCPRAPAVTFCSPQSYLPPPPRPPPRASHVDPTACRADLKVDYCGFSVPRQPAYRDLAVISDHDLSHLSVPACHLRCEIHAHSLGARTLSGC